MITKKLDLVIKVALAIDREPQKEKRKLVSAGITGPRTCGRSRSDLLSLCAFPSIPSLNPACCVLQSYKVDTAVGQLGTF